MATAKRDVAVPTTDDWIPTSPPGDAERSSENSAAPIVDDGIDRIDAGGHGGGHGTEWNGRKTQFTLAHPIVKDHIGIRAGQTVVYDASYHDGQWRGPDASTVVLQFQSGFFAGTDAARERARRAAAMEFERGVGRDPEGPDGPGPEGLEALTSDQQLALLEDMLRGGAAEAKRKEAQEARETTEAIRADRKALVADLADAIRGATSAQD